MQSLGSKSSLKKAYRDHGKKEKEEHVYIWSKDRVLGDYACFTRRK